jgi:transposase
MRDTDLFQMALGLVPPWMVKRSAFDATAKRLDIYLDFGKGSRFPCSECGEPDCPAYDTEEKTWRHLIKDARSTDDVPTFPSAS